MVSIVWWVQLGGGAHLGPPPLCFLHASCQVHVGPAWLWFAAVVHVIGHIQGGHRFHWPLSSLAAVVIGCCCHWLLSFSMAIVFVGHCLHWLLSLAVTVCWVGHVQLPSWLVVVAVLVEEGGEKE